MFLFRQIIMFWFCLFVDVFVLKHTVLDQSGLFAGGRRLAVRVVRWWNTMSWLQWTPFHFNFTYILYGPIWILMSGSQCLALQSCLNLKFLKPCFPMLPQRVIMEYMFKYTLYISTQNPLQTISFFPSPPHSYHCFPLQIRIILAWFLEKWCRCPDPGT